jgi:hypothetical protein
MIKRRRSLELKYIKTGFFRDKKVRHKVTLLKKEWIKLNNKLLEQKLKCLSQRACGFGN